MKLTNIYNELLNEDFKSQTKKFISQGFDPDIVKSYIDKFKYIRDKYTNEIDSVNYSKNETLSFKA